MLHEVVGAGAGDGGRGGETAVHEVPEAGGAGVAGGVTDSVGGGAVDKTRARVG